MAPAGNSASLPSVQWEQFDGPLNLLLDEVRRQNVSIKKISMGAIVARFLEYVRTATERNLNLDIEWLHMAATLIHWKSLSLLHPEDDGQRQADPIRDDLLQQLFAHRRQAAQELRRHRSAQEARLSRGPDAGFSEESSTEEPEEPSFVSVWDLIQQARELAQWVCSHREDRRHWRNTFAIEQDDVTVAEMVEYVRTQLTTAAGLKLDGLRLLLDQPTTSRRSCVFLAILEMARDQQLKVEQNDNFGPISLADVSAFGQKSD